MRWWEFFELNEPPYSKEIADRDLWLPDSRQEVVQEVIEAVEERAAGVLIVGEAGLGKSCILRAVRHQLPETGVRLTYCHNATLGRRDYYRLISHAMGLSPKATAAAVFYAISTHVQELSRERVHPVFLLDEAHLLHQDVLDHLHILANYEYDSRALMTIILVGLPDLWDRMLVRRNRSLWSRIHYRLSLGEPEPGDTVEYVRHRMQLAGCGREVFTSDALALLHEASGGRLRDIDRLATAALKRAARSRNKLIDRGIVSAAAVAHQHP